MVEVLTAIKVRWGQYGPSPKCWYPNTSIHSVTTQKTTTLKKYTSHKMLILSLRNVCFPTE